MVIRRVGRSGHNITWLCLCDCGKYKVLSSSEFKSGKTKSCGCYNSELITKRKTTHGMSKTAEYKSWKHMKERCYEVHCKDYVNYGGRGIVVSDDWIDSFENFYKDMGDKPSKIYSLDRINVNGNYENGNCRWATPKQQCNNQRRNIMIEYNGKTQSLKQWTNELGLRYEKSRKYYHDGVPIDIIFNQRITQ